MGVLLINQGTNAAINFDLSGTVNTQVIALGYGTLSTIGTIPNIPGGTLGSIIGIGSVSGLSNLPGGTLNSVGTIPGMGTLTNIGIVNNAGTLQAGTLGTVANIGSLGMLNAGTITTLPNIPGGTINILAGGTLGILTNGTLSSSGTTTGVGSVSSLGSLGMLNAGTISMLNAGTLTTIPNIPGGTINILAGGTLGILTNGTLSSSGTATGVGTMTNLGSVTNVGQLYNAGTVQNQLAGTITALQNGTITAGSIIVTAGTMSAGTLNTGTLSPIPTIANVTFGTHGTTGVSIFGTLAGGTGSGAGTEIFITSLSLTIPSTGGSQDASIGWGSNGGTFQAGTGLLVRGNFPPGGGIQKSFWPPVSSGTQAQLMLFQAGAGTVDVDVTYFITASTL